MLRRALWLLLGVVGACGSDSQPTTPGNGQSTLPTQPSADTSPLRTLASAKGRLVGSAVDRGFRYTGSDGVTFKAMLAREFSVLTPENDMKHERIHPSRDVFRFEPADSLVAFADANGMKVRGHTLVWHQQLAPWLTSDANVALFYNDFNIEGIGPKSDSLYELVKDFQARGVPISGIGLESHFQLGGIPSTLGANIARFAALGLKVHITELDVRMPLPSTAAQLQTQAQNYKDVFSTCLQYPACDLVVIWGFTDKESWVPSAFPGWGAALVFDATYQAKPAYTSLHDLLK